jgi:hypothetical protein
MKTNLRSGPNTAKERVAVVKRTVLVLLTAASLCGGCSTHYYITLTNGYKITAYSRPRLDKEGVSYVYKDANGNLKRVSAGGVAEISPTSMGRDSSLNSQPSR